MSERRTMSTDHGIHGVNSHEVFPGRNSLYCHEVARALSVTTQHVISLILEGELIAIEITGKGNKTSRGHWRVPVVEYDRFIERRRSDKKYGAIPLK